MKAILMFFPAAITVVLWIIAMRQRVIIEGALFVGNATSVTLYKGDIAFFSGRQSSPVSAQMLDITSYQDLGDFGGGLFGWPGYPLIDISSDHFSFSAPFWALVLVTSSVGVYFMVKRLRCH